jgi:hypothetical protein
MRGRGLYPPGTDECVERAGGSRNYASDHLAAFSKDDLLAALDAGQDLGCLLVKRPYGYFTHPHNVLHSCSTSHVASNFRDPEISRNAVTRNYRPAWRGLPSCWRLLTGSITLVDRTGRSRCPKRVGAESVELIEQDG